MGRGYTLLGYHPEVISRSFSAYLKVKLVKPREIFIFSFLTLLFRQIETNYGLDPLFRVKLFLRLIIYNKVSCWMNLRNL